MFFESLKQFSESSFLRISLFLNSALESRYGGRFYPDWVTEENDFLVIKVQLEDHCTSCCQVSGVTVLWQVEYSVDGSRGYFNKVANRLCSIVLFKTGESAINLN